MENKKQIRMLTTGMHVFPVLRLTFDTDLTPTRVTVNFKDAGLTGSVRLRDLWRRRDIGTFQDTFTTELPPHAPLFVRCFK
jgi:hypothetical protein